MSFQLKYIYIFVNACTAPYISLFNTYVTPAVNDSFDQFKITDSIPTDGRYGVGRKQPSLTIWDFKRKYITFNFKGNGNAQILFYDHEYGSNEKLFTVVIGGGISNSKVAIYKSKLKDLLNETTVDGITSEAEFRSYWIGVESDKIIVGLCHDPYQNEVLSAWIFRGMRGLEFESISLSTTSENKGGWQFALDYTMFGGCHSKGYGQRQEECVCIYGHGSLLHGTCVPYSLRISDAGFGNGRCRTGMITNMTTSPLPTQVPRTQVLSSKSNSGTARETITTPTPAMDSKPGQEKELDCGCGVEIIAAIVGGTVGSVIFLELVVCMLYMSCIHLSQAMRRRKVGLKDKGIPILHDNVL